MSNWDELSLRDKAEFIKVGVRNGLTSISDIKELYNKFLGGGPKKQAWVRYFRDVPEEFRDSNVDYEKEKNTKIWTDELGKPISRADLVNYDTSQRLLYNPTPNSLFDLSLLDKSDAEEIRRRKEDERINKNYSLEEWGKQFGILGALGTGIATGGIFLPYLAPGTTGGAMIGNTAGSMALGMGLEEALRSITGKSIGDLISGYLQSKGMSPFIAEMVRPEYFFNPTGTFTSRLTSKFGLVDPMKSMTHVGVGNSIPIGSIHGRSHTPIEELLHLYLHKVVPIIDNNLDKLQLVVNPLLYNSTKKANIEVPNVKLVREIDPTKKESIQLPRYNSDKLNERVYGDLLTLKSPNIKGKRYELWNNQSFLNAGVNLFDNILAGASAADIAISEDRDPIIRGLEYGILARRGLKGIINNRLRNHDKAISLYYHSLHEGLENTLNILHKYAILKNDNLNNQYRSLSLAARSLSSVAKPGINLEKASFQDLEKFIKKGNYDLYDILVTIDNGILYNKQGDALAKKRLDGGIEIINETRLSDFLLKDIDIIDYQTGKSYRGAILIDEDKNIVIPLQYLDILNNNIEYVKNKVFPNSGIKLYGSSSGVVGAGFPHATHDIDFYITLDNIDKLIKSGQIKDSDKISSGTYRYLINNNAYGEKGWIDLNVLEKDISGNATGIRAEELYKLYFPEEYYLALREALALTEQTGHKHPIKISRTPEELLEVMDPNTKSIMDAFDIDYLAPNKNKHKNRAWMHLVYSDPKKVSLGLLQYARSMLGENMQGLLLPLSKLLDVEVNIQALKKMGINLEEEEMQRVAKDPQRMKNVLDAWYIMDRTPMRYIKGTWPGVQGVTADNYINSATKWITSTDNGGNYRGAGLNFTVKGDSEHYGSLKAYISPKQNYESKEVLDLIDEINNKTGLNNEGRFLLQSLSSDPVLAKTQLQNIYNTTGKNFLSDLKTYGSVDNSIYVSGTRDFIPGIDNIGYSKLNTHMRPLIQRLVRRDDPVITRLKHDRLMSNLPYLSIQKNKYFGDRDYISLLGWDLVHPKRLSGSKGIGENLTFAGVGAFAAGLPSMYDSGLFATDPNLYITELDKDPVVISMSKEDKQKFLRLYIEQQKRELRKTIKSERKINKIIEDLLFLLYESYELKYIDSHIKD